MFRSLEARRRRAAEGDAGFTLLEVVIALAILAVAATASLGFILTGYRAATRAKMDTVGRNITQASLEKLHNLPYHIAADVSTSQDLLDLYYPNATGSAGRGATGYVPAAATRYTADGDPATGAFYRTVVSAVPSFTTYKQYITLQFLNTDGTVVPPVTGWAAGTAGSDKPASNQIAATATTFWSTSSVSHKYTSYTQISAGRPAVPRINLQERLTALTITGALAGGNQLTLIAGDLDVNGSLANTSSAAATLTGASVEIGGVARTTGASVSVLAPPNVTGVGTTNAGNSVTDSGQTVAAFASNAVGNAAAGTVSGQPYIASNTTPAYAQLSSPGAGQLAGWFTNEPNDSGLGLTPTTSLVQIPNASCGNCPAASVQGYATSSSTSSTHTATAVGALSTGGGGAGSQSAPITLFPTLGGGNGLVQIALSSATLNCGTTGNFGSTSTGTATITYQAYLRYITYNGGSYSWSSWIGMNGASADPLASVDMSTSVGPVNGQNRVLGDYIASWSSLTSGALASGRQVSADGKSTRGSYSLLTLNTQPLRSGDGASGIGVTLGTLTCTAEDNR